MSFMKAYKLAKKNYEKEFEWGGKTYQMEIAPAKKPVKRKKKAVKKVED